MALTTLDPENSVLFTGSGFNAGATAIDGNELPQGNPLTLKLAQFLGIDPAGYDLQTITQEFVEDNGEALYEVLYKTFTVSALTDAQRTILQLPWRRIYTTNYDDAIQLANPSLNVFSLNESKPRSLPRRCAIHLHGSIRNCTPSNVLSQLVLNEDSYIRRTVESSPWFVELERDVRYSNATFLIGYSLSDHHVAARLRTTDEARASTFFVTRDRPARVFLNRAKRYGTISPVGVSGFASLIRTLPRPAAISDINKLRSFRYVDPFPDRKTLHPATTAEIFNLVAFGTFNPTRFISTYPAEDYVITRKEIVSEVVSELTINRTVLIHSRLGNGKTILLSLLGQAMTEKGYKVFRWRSQSSSLEQELDLLSKSGRILILIDDYDEAFEVIGRIAAAVPEAKFVVTARSSQQAVRFHEISERFPGPIKRVSVNPLSRSDREALFKLLDRAGHRLPDLRRVVSEAPEIRDVVLHLYRNADVRKKIDTALAPVIGNHAFKFLSISAQLCAWVGATASHSFLGRTANIDTQAELDRCKAVASDFLTFDDQGIGARSALFSEYMIAHHFDLYDVINVIYALVTSAIQFMNERNYRKLIGGLMHVNSLKRLLRDKESLESGLNQLFENLARDIYVNREPLFWLQFAILKIEGNGYLEAEGHLETSYARAEESPGFETYQLDTQALRIALQIETEFSPSGPIVRMDRIIKGLRDVRPMITDESHRFFAMNVLARFEPFVIKRDKDFEKAEAIGLVPDLLLLITSLNALAPELQAESGARAVAASLSRSITRLELRAAA